jgi:hypothetical protein
MRVPLSHPDGVAALGMRAMISLYPGSFLKVLKISLVLGLTRNLGTRAGLGSGFGVVVDLRILIL